MERAISEIDYEISQERKRIKVTLEGLTKHVNKASACLYSGEIRRTIHHIFQEAVCLNDIDTRMQALIEIKKRINKNNI